MPKYVKIDDVVKLVEVYTENEGLIADKKFLRKDLPHQISPRWISTVEALDKLVRKVKSEPNKFA